MSIIGPRPLLVEYLPWYTEEERHRHDIRPGLTGWAQVHGRNDLDWEHRFQYDLYYVTHYSCLCDVKIIISTVFKVLRKENLRVDTNDSEGNMAEIRKQTIEGANAKSNFY